MSALDVFKLLANQKKLEELLLLEKKRRGVCEDKMVFVGMSNVSSYYWCAAKSLLQSRAEELKFFSAYLHDRILYSKELGLINEIPDRNEELLEVGSNISFEDIEYLLQQRKKVAIPDYIETGEVVEVLKSLGLVSLEDPMDRGQVLERRGAERYPTIRWNFKWEDYVVVGVPDGITDSFVYEFKTTRSPFLLRYVKPVAFTQADLYGYFFRRDTKRVQIYVTETGETRTWVEKVDKENAEEALRKFKEVDAGVKPPRPREWKCRACELREKCL